ncbi:glycosyltransferase [Microbacterium sp. M3]|uniref:D-inositol 3-phosphate glycosyltransferase n=2 Tax=Microbacterium arthrosphaerae TaxID=792652 RepID=A0ABU4H5C8_9MICO|nr:MULTISPECIES: glycosyltransferase [Microbacterium]MDW4573869.1 glycosyltransferase [Microbacterium arthrosphaerae]MDW7607724.1 glycosyltransferase [Microbacterium sp. M3]
MVDTGWRGENARIIPNGKPGLSDVADMWEWSKRPISMITVGRIEPRKRSLELAQAAASKDARIVFAGSLGDERSTYAQQFLNLAESSPTVDYRGSISHDEVLRLMGQSRVLVNASWVEVQSLVDLEAAHLGTRVVSLPNGNSEEWLPDHVTYTPDFDLDQLVDTATAAASTSVGPGAPSYAWDWQRAADSLHALYLGS